MKTKESNQKMTISENEYDLVKGEFSPEEAKDIINHLISKKISFHEVKNFSNEIRFGKADEKSTARVKELLQAKDALNQTIQQAQEEGKSVRIDSSIVIEII